MANFLPAGYEDDLDDLGAVGGGIGAGGWDDLDVEAYEARLLDLNNLEDFEGEFDEDEDYDFYDDDFEMWDSFDEDEDFPDSSDEERDRCRVFQTLQDSLVVLPQIQFHLTEPEGPSAQPRTRPERRWPKVRADKHEGTIPETYESLHKVLLELEVLLKAWKRRVSHPFTAHLKRKTKEDGGQNNAGWLDMLSGTDIESDDPEAAGAAAGQKQPSQKAKKVSESLTKKKYCQTTRLFFDIFDTDLEMDQTLGLIKRIRKTVHNIAFSLFLECFGENSHMRTLPPELQEKIWLMTQDPYRDDEAFHAGLRFGDDPEGLWVAEEERITDLFAAAGNLHMMVFEFMFKQVQVPPNEALWTTSDLMHGCSYPRVLFHKHLKLLRTAFQRFKALVPPVREAEAPSLELRTQLEQGVWSLNLQGKPNKIVNCVATVTADNQINPYFVQMGMRSDDVKLHPDLSLSVVDGVLDKVVATIHTKLSALHDRMPEKCISIHEKTVSVCRLVTPEDSLASLHSTKIDLEFEISSWVFEGSSVHQLLGSAEAKTFTVRLPFYSVPIPTVCLKTTHLEDEGLVHLIHSRDYPKADSTSTVSMVAFISASSGQVIDKMIWDNDSVGMVQIKRDLMVMWCGPTAPKWIVVDLNTRTEVASIETGDICSPDSCKRLNYSSFLYAFVFDAVKDEFVVACHRWHFKTYSYKYDEEAGVVVNPSAKGSVKENYGSVNPFPTHSVYVGGLLLGLQTRTPYYELNISPGLLRRTWIEMERSYGSLMALDLERGTEMPLIDVATSTTKSMQKMNNFHRWIERESGPSDPFAQRVAEDKVVFGLGKTRYLAFDLHTTEDLALRKDCKTLKARHEAYLEQKRLDEAKEKKLKGEAAERKKQDAERKALYDKATEEFVGTGVTLKGKIHSWKSDRGFGFVRPTGEAEPLGNIFLHISDVQNVSKGYYPCYNREIEFEVRREDDKTNPRAVNVVLGEKVVRPAQSQTENGSGGGAGRRNFRRGRGGGGRKQRKQPPDSS